MNVLNRTCPGVKAALRHDAIVGKKVIGRGRFSLVFDNGENVLHLTADPVAYALFCDGAVCVEGDHFPTVTENYGEIGQTNNDISLFLYETEKLEKVRNGSWQKKLARQITAATMNVPYRKGKNTSHDKLHSIVENADFGAGINDALRQLASFASYFETAALDMHAANFMVRPITGDLIFNDPLCCFETYDQSFSRYDYRRFGL